VRAEVGPGRAPAIFKNPYSDFFPAFDGFAEQPPEVFSTVW
jgi:hypothetical protein